MMKPNQTSQSNSQRTHGSRIVVAALLFAGLAALPARAAKMGAVTGVVEVGRGEPPAWTRLVAGDELSPGDLIRTARNARAEVQLDAGTVRVYGNSLLRLPSGSQAKTTPETETLTLWRGHSIFDVIRNASGRVFEVKTPEVVVSVKGTRFSVNLDGAGARVVVFRGTVGVWKPGADKIVETLVREGFAAVAGAGRPFELELAPEIDPWAQWDRGIRQREMPAAPEPAAGKRDPAVEKARRASTDASAAKVLKHAMRRNPALARAVVERMNDESGRFHQHPSGEPPVITQMEGDSFTTPAALDLEERDQIRRHRRRRGQTETIGTKMEGIQIDAMLNMMEDKDVQQLMEDANMDPAAFIKLTADVHSLVDEMSGSLTANEMEAQIETYLMNRGFDSRTAADVIKVMDSLFK